VVTSPPVPDRDPLSVTTAVEDGWIGSASADLVLESGRLAVWRVDDRATEIETCTATNR
jgi:hypothetical protein